MLIADVLDICVGMQSDVYKKHLHLPPAQPTGGSSTPAAPEVPQQHLFLSLVLMGALPPRPDEIDDEADDGSTSLTERATLDLSFDDEELFGYWVSALRGLLSEGQQRPAAYPTPYAPLHASAGIALRLAAPKDATMYERLRDAVLLGLDLYTKTRVFLVLTIIWALAVVVFGVLFFFLLVGWHGFEEIEIGSGEFIDGLTNTTISGQDRANDLGNICIHILTALFTYISFFTLPWRVANAIHLIDRRRSSKAGVDFYGRPTKGIWFHIPPRKRAWIVALLCGNFLCQYATQICRFVWSDYPSSQVMPGALWINLTFVGSIVCGAVSGGMQGSAEGGVRKAKPGEFPPTPMEIFIESFKSELHKHRGEMKAAKEQEKVVADKPSPQQSPQQEEEVQYVLQDLQLGAPPTLDKPVSRTSYMVSGQV